MMKRKEETDDKEDMDDNAEMDDIAEMDDNAEMVRKKLFISTKNRRWLLRI